MINQEMPDQTTDALVLPLPKRTSRLHRIRKVPQHIDGGVPIDTCVGDGHTLLERGLPALTNILAASAEVGLDHHTHNPLFAGAQLAGDGIGDLWLVLLRVSTAAGSTTEWGEFAPPRDGTYVVVLGGVAVRAINHHDLALVLLLERLLCGGDVLGGVVRALRTSTENHEAVVVSGGAGDGGETLFGDTHEVVGVCGGEDRVDGNRQGAISAVLESNRERHTGGELTMQLALSCARTDSSNGQAIGEELGGNGIEHLARNWNPHVREVDEQSAGDAQTLVDLVRLIDIGVVDESLPANGCARLLEVGTHDDDKFALDLGDQGLELLSVFKGGGGVVDGARADDDKELVGLACDHGDGIAAAGEDGGFAGGGLETKSNQFLLA